MIIIGIILTVVVLDFFGDMPWNSAVPNNLKCPLSNQKPHIMYFYHYNKITKNAYEVGVFPFFIPLFSRKKIICSVITSPDEITSNHKLPKTTLIGFIIGIFRESQKNYKLGGNTLTPANYSHQSPSPSSLMKPENLSPSQSANINKSPNPQYLQPDSLPDTHAPSQE